MTKESNKKYINCVFILLGHETEVKANLNIGYQQMLLIPYGLCLSSCDGTWMNYIGLWVANAYMCTWKWCAINLDILKVYLRKQDLIPILLM